SLHSDGMTAAATSASRTGTVPRYIPRTTHLSWRLPIGPARQKLRVRIASNVTMKATLTAKAARKPVSGGSGTPKTQLAEIGSKSAKSHGHHGPRPPAGATSGGKISAARRSSGSITREAQRKTTSQA